MPRPKGSKNRRTVLREAELAMADRGEFLAPLYVLESGMRHFFVRAMQLKQTNADPAAIDANLLHAVNIAEKIAPYRHARLSAMKLAGDPNAHKDVGDDAPIAELKRLVEHHLMVLAPVLDLQILPLDGNDDPEPGDEIADCDAPQGRAGNDAGVPQGRRRARDHRGGIG
jgi:hypothetical protein